MNIKNKYNYKFYTIYKTTNLINNKKYIGMHSTNNLNDNYLGSGKILQKAIKKYGKENFTKEILHIFDNFDDMTNKEREIINSDIFESDEYYNLKEGGEGGRLSEEIINKIATKNKGRQVSKEAIEKSLQSRIDNGTWYKSGKDHHFYGKTHSDDTKNLITNKLKENYKNGYKVWNDGLKLSEIYTEEERKAKYGQNKNKHIHSKETKLKFSKMNSGSNNPSFGSKWYGHPTELLKCYVKNDDIELENKLIENGWKEKPDNFMKRKSITKNIKDYIND